MLFKNLLTSARFIVMRFYKLYDVIMTSRKFARIQILSVMSIFSHATNLPVFSSIVMKENIERLKKILYAFYNLVAINLADINRF